MATFILQPGFNDVEIMTDEADTIVLPEGDGSRDRVFNFDPAFDRIDISLLSGVTAQELLDSSISRPNSLLLVGSFGTINLFGVPADQLSADNFIIAGGNQPPIATDDEVITTIGTAVEIAVLDNDFDSSGDIISIIDFEANTISGGIVLANDNLLMYIPADDFFGTDSFIYTISDGEGTATAAVTVEVVSPVEPVLIALDDLAITMVDMAVDIDVLANDPIIADVDAIAIASFEDTTVNSGTVTLNDNGTPDNPFDDLLTYIPGAGFFGTDSFSYRISNSLGTGTAAVTVEVVLPVEPPLVATPDFAETSADMAVNIDVIANDFAPGGGPEIAIASFAETTASGGTVTLNDNGTPDDPFDDLLEYSPAEGFTGSDSFSYTISNALNIGEAEVTVQVVPTPTPPPEAMDDFVETFADSPVNIDVLANDFNPTGDRFPLTEFPGTTANGGTITRDDKETPDDLTDDSLIYTPPEGFIGVDSFTYSVSDVFPGAGTATVTVEVLPDEGGLVAVDDAAVAQGSESETIAVLANDFNPEGPPFGLIFFDSITENGGTVTRDNNDTPRLTDDKLVYTAADGFTGVDSFTYSIGDARGNISAATVDVTVESAPAPGPVAVDDRADLLTGERETIAILENDFNPNGDPFGLIFFERTTENGGTITRDNNDTARLTDDKLIYTGADGFIGEDSFTYSISDAFGNFSTAVVNVTVSEGGDNEPPVATDDFASFFDFDAPIGIFVLDNDFDPDNDALTIVDFEGTTASGGTVVSDEGFLVYTPAFGFSGTDSFSYSISDGLATDTATVNLIVQVIDDSFLIALDDLASTEQGIPVDIFVLDNDLDPDVDIIAIAGFPETTALGGTVTFSDNDSPEDPFDDFLTYTPALGFAGTDSFSYTITDGEITSTATVTVTVSEGGENQSPIASDDFALSDGGVPVNIFVLDNDLDPDGDPIAIAGFPETTGNGGNVSISGNSLVYTPAEGFFGTDSFIYTISDDRGGTDTATVTVTVPVIDEGPPPVANDDLATTTENIPVDIFVLDNDFDADGDPLAIAGFPETTFGGTVALSDNDSPEDPFDDFLTYSPAEGFTGTDSFTYTINDDRGGTSAGTVTVTVESAGDNAPPIAQDDEGDTIENFSVNIPVLENDFDEDGDILEIIGFETTTLGGTVLLQDNVTPDDPTDDFLAYIPDFNFTGTDSFTYTISDGLATDTGTVTVTVNPPLSLPLVAEDDFASTNENIPVEVFVLDNDLSPDGVVQLLDFQDVTASGGTVFLGSNGTPFDLSDDSLIYTSAEGFSGTDSFSYSIGDGSGQTATGFVIVEVGAVGDNETPIASDDFAETLEGVPVTIPTLDNDFTPDGTIPRAIDIPERTTHGGTVEFDDNGSLVYTPAPGFIGTDDFSYIISDESGNTDTAFVSIIVDRFPVDLLPPILDQQVYTSGNDPVDILVLENNFDPRDIRREILDFEDTPEGGTVTLDDNSTPEDPTDDFLTYTPTDGFIGTDAFSYSFLDDRGFTSTAFVTVTVLPEGQSAVAIDDLSEIFLPEENQVNVFVLENDISLNENAIALTDFEETTAGGGTVTRNENGTPEDFTDDFLLYTASEDFSGTDSFTYSISDGSSTDSAVVNVVNFSIIQPPILPTAFAADDRAFAIANSSANISVLDNDFSFDAPELIRFDETTENGGTVTRNDNETPQDLTDDRLVYSPASDFIGTDSFRYSIIDDFSFTSSTAVVNVVVVPPDSTVFATDDEAEVIKNNPTTLFVLENDFEVDGNLLEIISFDETTANGGTVSLDESFFFPEIGAGGDARATDDIIIEPFPPIGGPGYLFYSPADDFTGTDSFTYTVSNPDGVTDTATVRVTVAPSAPFAGFAFGQTFENAPVTIDVLSSAFDFDRDSISLTDFEVTSTFGGTVSLDDNDTPDNQTDDKLLYQPATGFTGFDDLNYTITDSSGLTDVGEVSVNVLPAPAGFAAVDDFVQTIDGLPVKVDVLGNEFAIDDGPLSLISFEEETENGGTLTRFENNTPDDLTDDYLVYEAGELLDEFYGFDRFSYTIANADGITDRAVVNVDIAPSYTIFAEFDRAYTFTEVPINIDVLANDYSTDGSPLELIGFDPIAEFAEGAIARDDNNTPEDLTDDSLIYSPTGGFTGYDSFTYSIADGAGNTTTGYVDVSVDPVPEIGFAAIDDFVNSSENSPQTISVLDNDFSESGSPLLLKSFEETTFYGGTIARDDNGTADDLTDDKLEYTPPAPDANEFPVFYDSFTYSITDAADEFTSTAYVEVEISPEPPIATQDAVETLVNTAVNIPVLENDIDPNLANPGDIFSSLRILGFETTTVNGGQVILDSSYNELGFEPVKDSLTYIPALGFTGTDSFSYSINGGFFPPFGGTDTALVTVTVL